MDERKRSCICTAYGGYCNAILKDDDASFCAYCAAGHSTFTKTAIAGTQEKVIEEKLKFTLLPLKSTKEVLRVLNFGAIKHNEKPGEDKWRSISKQEHLDAAFRHYMAHVEGEALDPESSLPHLAHAICRLMFAMEV